MSERRRSGLGKGLGALIPSGPGVPRPVGRAEQGRRPADVFFGGGHPQSAVALVEPPARSIPSDATPLDEARGGDAAGAAQSAVELSPGGNGPVDRLAAADVGDAPRDSTATRNGATDAAATDDSTTEEVATDVPADDLLGVPGAVFLEIPVVRVRPNARQPRQIFDDDELAELVASIREVGVLQPIVVRADPAGGYELVMGERRWRAAQQAGLPTVPAIVRGTPDTDLLRDALLENLHRSQLNPLEEAAAYDQLLSDFDCTHDELATRIGRSRPQISNTIRLLNLPALVQRRVAAGVLSAGHARALLGLADAGAMERLAQRIVAEGLSVRATEEIVTLGVGEDEPRRPRRPAASNEVLDEIAARLSDRLDTRVKVAMGAKRGRLTVEFAGHDDLDRILGLLSPH